MATVTEQAVEITVTVNDKWKGVNALIFAQISETVVDSVKDLEIMVGDIDLNFCASES